MRWYTIVISSFAQTWIWDLWQTGDRSRVTPSSRPKPSLEIGTSTSPPHWGQGVRKWMDGFEIQCPTWDQELIHYFSWYFHPYWRLTNPSVAICNFTYVEMMLLMDAGRSEALLVISHYLYSPDCSSLYKTLLLVIFCFLYRCISMFTPVSIYSYCMCCACRQYRCLDTYKTVSFTRRSQTAASSTVQELQLADGGQVEGWKIELKNLDFKGAKLQRWACVPGFLLTHSFNRFLHTSVLWAVMQSRPVCRHHICSPL